MCIEENTPAPVKSDRIRGVYCKHLTLDTCLFLYDCLCLRQIAKGDFAYLAIKINMSEIP